MSFDIHARAHIVRGAASAHDRHPFKLCTVGHLGNSQHRTAILSRLHGWCLQARWAISANIGHPRKRSTRRIHVALHGCRTRE